MTSERDILIVGGGLAGLFLALKLAPRRCTVIALAPLGQAAASAWAQGGMAAALSPADDPKLHAADTVAAGAGIVDPVVAQLIAESGPARIRDLLAMGVPFDRTARQRSLLSALVMTRRARAFASAPSPDRASRSDARGGGFGCLPRHTRCMSTPLSNLT